MTTGERALRITLRLDTHYRIPSVYFCRNQSEEKIHWNSGRADFPDDLSAGIEEIGAYRQRMRHIYSLIKLWFMMLAPRTYEVEPDCPVATNIHVHSRDVLLNVSPRNPQSSKSPMLIACVLWLLAGSRLYGQASHGTAAISIWTPDKIVLATDSKVREVTGLAETSYDACKIVTTTRFSFAMSGIYNDRATGFDAWKLAREALSGAKTIPGATTAVESAIRPRLETAIAEMRKSNPGVLTKSYLTFAIAGVDSGKLVVALRDFVPGAGIAPIDVLTEEFPGTRRVAADSIGISIFGERDAIDIRYSESSMAQLLRSQDITLSAIQLVQLEIDNNPAKVGPPRSILEVRRSGRKWIERGLCKQPNH